MDWHAWSFLQWAGTLWERSFKIFGSYSNGFNWLPALNVKQDYTMHTAWRAHHWWCHTSHPWHKHPGQPWNLEKSVCQMQRMFVFSHAASAWHAEDYWNQSQAVEQAWIQWGNNCLFLSSSFLMVCVVLIKLVAILVYSGWDTEGNTLCISKWHCRKQQDSQLSCYFLKHPFSSQWLS